jgi:CRISPR-associated protein Cas2
MARLWIVTYDIADPQRLRRIAQALEDEGERVQQSVFEIWANRDRIRRLRQRLRPLLDLNEDSLRWYPLCGACVTRVRWQGPGGQPGGANYWVV